MIKGFNNETMHDKKLLTRITKNFKQATLQGQEEKREANTNSIYIFNLVL
jgi:hypothetical protein